MKRKLTFLIPRILIILFAVFLALFSLDVFDSCSGFNCVLGLFIHNIPSIFLIVLLIISWKHDLAGAIIFGCLGILGFIGLLFVGLIYNENRSNFMLAIIGVVFLLAGILFFIRWKRDNRKKK
ncbi:MAG TPA: LPXTG cell wall anchor domain-containing protein [Candidatus Paceibacterota bacterium]|nr:LPXTG cell wall anchor domain-containing protein [Candidatus Paceibacterota bacterium]